jgi:hypothetical protein
MHTKHIISTNRSRSSQSLLFRSVPRLMLNSPPVPTLLLPNVQPKANRLHLRRFLIDITRGRCSDRNENPSRRYFPSSPHDSETSACVPMRTNQRQLCTVSQCVRLLRYPWHDRQLWRKHRRRFIRQFTGLQISTKRECSAART